MQLTHENRSDIDKYYRNTFVKFSGYAMYNEDFPFDPDTLFYIQSVKEDHIAGIIEDETPFEIFFDDEDPIELKYPLPHKSFFQRDKTAVLLQRIPARQYKRGITAENTSLWSVRADGTCSSQPISFKLLQAYVKKQQWYPLRKAMDKMSWSSVALHPRFAYVPAKGTILADATIVAQVGSGVIKMVKPCFKSEIVQLLASNGELGMFTITE